MQCKSATNSYYISHLLITVTTYLLDSDSEVTVIICQQHGDFTATGSLVTSSWQTVTILSQSSR